jgi:tetratricopeptide (TPR) repeat protein
VPVIIDLTRKAEFEVWANRTEKAEQMYSEILTMQEKYHQQDNPVVTEVVRALRQKIDNRNCVTAANQCFALNRQVETRIKYHNYEEAKQLLDKAFRVIENNPGCRIDRSDFDLYRKKYKKVFTYLGIKYAARESLDSGNYDQAVEDFIRLENYYSTNRLQNYGLEPVRLDDVIKSSGLPTFTDAACKYYIKQKDYQQAFEYLSLLKDQKVPPKNVKDLQVLLGSLLAQNDSAAHADPRAMVREYTGGEKWFRYFRVAYMQH